ncbi:hypothetical protein [Tessaracoccus sp. Z1128]
MRRRHPAEDTNPMPLNLRRFRAEEWPGDTELRQWYAHRAALLAWANAHPDVDTEQWTEPWPAIGHAYDPDLI